ncbi:hypothetical protein BX600DRAFT_442735 [Xylariales sp. PMI_506]|nr:hypothetical protein BX600DRAFT_442735 [Xylariales sp. PMI_506]
MSAKPSLTPRELEIAGLVWQCFESDPKVNYVKLAEIARFKNPASASACWLPIKKKLIAAASAGSSGEGGASGGGGGTPSKGKGSATKRKNAPAKDSGDSPETPTKKARGRSATAAKKAAPAEEPGVEDDGEKDGGVDEYDAGLV